MKPWERALKREPMCAFIEAVVDGYSPLDKSMLKLGRAGQLLRSLPWWEDLSFATAKGPRGDFTKNRQKFYAYGPRSGEIEWR